MIAADEVLRVMHALADAGIAAWLDGGWGVDALLREQTREHDDLDLIVELSAVEAVCGALAPLGYSPGEDERPTRLVLDGPSGRRIDLHTVAFDDGGGGVQHLQDGRSYRYPPEGFSGVGEVAGHRLPCLSAEVQLECHQGYKPTDTDREDVGRLAKRFGIRPPRAYR